MNSPGLADLAGKNESEIIEHIAKAYSDVVMWSDVPSYAPDSPEALKASLVGAEFLIAYENEEGDNGSSWFLFRQAGKLFEVTASHCSCYGFEGQWLPEEVTKMELLKRNLSWWVGEDNHETVIARILEL